MHDVFIPHHEETAQLIVEVSRNASLSINQWASIQHVEKIDFLYLSDFDCEADDRKLAGFAYQPLSVRRRAAWGHSDLRGTAKRMMQSRVLAAVYAAFDGEAERPNFRAMDVPLRELTDNQLRAVIFDAVLAIYGPQRREILAKDIAVVATGEVAKQLAGINLGELRLVTEDTTHPKTGNPIFPANRILIAARESLVIDPRAEKAVERGPISYIAGYFLEEMAVESKSTTKRIVECFAYAKGPHQFGAVIAGAENAA